MTDEIINKLNDLQNSISEYIKLIKKIDIEFEKDKQEYDDMKRDLELLKIDADKFIEARLKNGVFV